jgi:hypothetical protein
MNFEDTFIVDEYELQTDMIESAVKSLAERETYEVAHAFYEGYDGVDVHVDECVGWETIQWNESPPSYGPFDGPISRYDFRGMSYTDLKR